MDTVLSFKTVIVIFVSGLLASLIIGDFLSLVIVTAFIASEFNLLNLVYTQIPEDLRDKYNSKMLVVLEHLADILRQGEHKMFSKAETLIRSESNREIRVSKKRQSKDE